MISAEEKPPSSPALKPPPKTAALDSQDAQKNGDSLAIQWKPAKPATATFKAEKLQVVKSKGKEDAYTVKVNEQNSFRVRISDAGFMVVLTWREEPGKWPERYLCYLSKLEWKKARQGNLSAFVALVLMKLDERKTTEKGDAEKLDLLAQRVRLISN